VTGSRESGFTLVGVVVAMAILTILIAAVGPTISTIVQRDKETELVFRGKQFARAVLVFQRRFGRYPNSLKELKDARPRAIRKLWREPLCNCEDGWIPIIAGTPEAMPMSALPTGGQPRTGFGRTPTPGGFGNQPPSTYTGTGPTPPPFLGGAPPTPTPPSIFDQGLTGEVKTVGPIVGVRTKIREKAVKKWRDHDYTDEWRFIAGDADNDNPNQRITYPVMPANPNQPPPPPQQPRT
jgi:type II secretory pathway pseudopilin PulG